MIFFTSDHHFDHFNIIKYCQRPFSSVEEMNDEMIKRWNSVVSPQDTVYYLGDFSLSKRPVHLIAPLLHGEKHLIMGNHDVCHPLHKKKAEAGRKLFFEAGFRSLSLEEYISIGGKDVLMSHMPYLSKDPIPEYERLYRDFRPTEKGLWLLHGHVHQRWKVKEKMINVGVDVWDFYPVPLAEIEKLMRENVT